MTLVHDLTVQQGVTFRYIFAVTGIASIEGMSAQLQIRPFKSSDEVLADWSSAGGQIVVDNVNKQIVITVPKEITRLYDWETGVYDLELNGGDYRVAEGAARLSGEVTR
jgi:hypothetical protein